LSFAINLQGGSPFGYSQEQPWINSAFTWDGELRLDYMARLEAILDRADELGMAPMLGFFYFGQEPRMAGDGAVRRAVETATDWLLTKGYTNVLVEVANECNVHYRHEIIQPVRIHELIEMVKARSQGKVSSPAGRLLVSTSFCGNSVPTDNVAASADFLLLHGNGVEDPQRIRQMVDQCRRLPSYHGQPILFNEDDHFNFDRSDNNMLAAIGRYASWGYFDFRMKGEGFFDGYQSMPTDWSPGGSERKRGFFRLLSGVTGSEYR
jgi:hypothetical protein